MSEQTKQSNAALDADVIAKIAATTAVTLAEEMRKPDPAVAEQKERHRQRIRAERERQEANRIAREKACPGPHRREDNTSAIAWMTTPAADGLHDYTRGVCQRCQRLIQPTDPDFLELLRVPTGVAFVR